MVVVGGPAPRPDVFQVIWRAAAPVAQLDRVAASEAAGRGFESRRARQLTSVSYTDGMVPLVSMDQRNTSANLSLGGVWREPGIYSTVTSAQREELWRAHARNSPIRLIPEVHEAACRSARGRSPKCAAGHANENRGSHPSGGRLPRFHIGLNNSLPLIAECMH